MKKNNNEEKVKVKIDKRKLLTKIMATCLLTIMVFASFATCIYYVIASV